MVPLNMNKFATGRWYLFTLVFVASASAHAFPENVRHGYVNCTSCHVSPTGGGTLTPYGRSLSSELMSTWSFKNEEGFLNGAIKEEQMPEWLMIGGDLRVLQTYVDTPTFTLQRFIKMQATLEAAVHLDKFTIDGDFGRVYSLSGLERWGSRRYFAMYNLSDELTVRVGRFYPEFGINTAEHYIESRKQLGFDEGMERDNLEVAYNGENYSAFLTASKQPGEVATTVSEKSVAAQVNKNIGDSSKAGVSAWYGKSDTSSRKVLGVHGVLGFTKRFYLLSELDHQWSTSTTTQIETRGFYAYNRLGYELTKGLIAFGHAEYGQDDVTSGISARDAYGPGVQWFPRPHFELVGLWRFMRSRATSADFYSYGYIQGHYYF